MLFDIAMLLLGVILTAGTFIFVSAEFSLVALDQAVVESRAAAGDARARQVGQAIKNLSTQLSGSQVGITLTTILLGYTTHRRSRIFSPRRESASGYQLLFLRLLEWVLQPSSSM